jgi:hypothetical protein
MLDLRAEVQAVAGHIMHLPFARPRPAPQPALEGAPPAALANAAPTAPGSPFPALPESALQAPPESAPQPVPGNVDGIPQGPQQTISQSIQRPAQ